MTVRWKVPYAGSHEASLWIEDARAAAARPRARRAPREAPPPALLPPAPAELLELPPPLALPEPAPMEPDGAHMLLSDGTWTDAPSQPLAEPGEVAASRQRDWLMVRSRQPAVAPFGPDYLFVPKWKRIAIEVALKHKVSLNELLSRRRSRQVVLARQEACWHLKNETSLSLPEIGRHINRDHTTVMYNIRQYEARLAAGQVRA